MYDKIIHFLNVSGAYNDGCGVSVVLIVFFFSLLDFIIVTFALSREGRGCNANHLSIVVFRTVTSYSGVRKSVVQVVHNGGNVVDFGGGGFVKCLIADYFNFHIEYVLGRTDLFIC